MTIKVLIIDDSRDFRSLLRLFLNKQFNDIEISEYDPEESGKPDSNFDWANYNVLLLDYKLGLDEDGLQWLKEFGKLDGFPPTIILTAEGDEYVAIKSMKLGAADYINKKDVSAKRLAEMINEAIEFTPNRREECEAEANKASEILEQFGDDGIQTGTVDIGYKFVRKIGHGAMSDVFLAERNSDKQTVVLKILNLKNVDNETYTKRFMQEAELLAGINSPFIIKVYDYGITDDYAYIAMEFLPRGDLKQRYDLGFTPEIATLYLNHIAYGLNEIHKVGIIHRDIKPANIMFRGDDSLAIADFGISKKLDEGQALTTIGQILGTPHYMSPEQGEGRAIDARSDIYSIGVMYYEFLAREKPYKGSTASSLIYQHVHADIPKLQGDLAPYQKIIYKTMAKDPDKRYQTAEELIEALTQAEQGIFH